MSIRRLAACTFVPVLVTALLAGCTGDTEPSNEAAVNRPVVGECRTYDAAAADSPVEDSSPVPCDDEHTAETIAVLDGLPDPTSDGRWTDAQLEAAAARGCGPAVHAKALGIAATALASTRFAQTFFAPTTAQAKAGARWVRCDSVVFADGDPSLVVGRHRDLLAAPGAFALCSARPPADAFSAVRCGDAKDADDTLYAAVGAVDLAPYASAAVGKATEAAQSEVIDRCRAITRSAADTGDPTWQTTFPAEGVVGDGVARCWLRVADWELRDEASWPVERTIGSLVAA